jgi:hypothetical protein
MGSKNLSAAVAALALLMITTATVFADDHPYAEGPVVNIASIRTVDGHFEEYMKFVASVWKQTQEAAKKTGDVVNYQVLTVEPRTPDDPDLYLVVTYKNWAALDGSIAKSDAITKAVSGSLTAADKALAERASIRRVLGSQTMQVLTLK